MAGDFPEHFGHGDSDSPRCDRHADLVAHCPVCTGPVYTDGPVAFCGSNADHYRRTIGSDPAGCDDCWKLAQDAMAAKRDSWIARMAPIVVSELEEDGASTVTLAGRPGRGGMLVGAERITFRLREP